MAEDIVFSVSEFVDVFNQTLEFAYPNVVISGEIANFRVSKNRWVYFDLKDDNSTLKFFGTVYQLPGPLEDGLMVKVRGIPRLHNLYGFSVNILNIQPEGEGSIKKAASLLQAKLAKEGLFDESRKRLLPYPPEHIGLITSSQSAAYADFIKILKERWQGLEISLIDVQVQGEAAVSQVSKAIEYFNSEAKPPEVIVIIRGGGSAEDLAAFNTEQVTRAVAVSRVPTMVAIGHEVDISLAELAADKRASTPSNAAQLLVPEKSHVSLELRDKSRQIDRLLALHIQAERQVYKDLSISMHDRLTRTISDAKYSLFSCKKLLSALNPETILNRGYAIVRDSSGQILKDVRKIKPKSVIQVQLAKGKLRASVEGVDRV